MDTYENIIKGKYIVYAETAQAKALIAGLLHLDPTKRLGCGAKGVAEIRDHPWFTKGGFTWDAVDKRTAAPPHVPPSTSVRGGTAPQAISHHIFGSDQILRGSLRCVALACFSGERRV